MKKEYSYIWLGFLLGCLAWAVADDVIRYYKKQKEDTLHLKIDEKYKVGQRVGYSVTTESVALITQVYCEGWAVMTWQDSIQKVDKEFAKSRLLQAEKEKDKLIKIEAAAQEVLKP